MKFVPNKLFIFTIFTALFAPAMCIAGPPVDGPPPPIPPGPPGNPIDGGIYILLIMAIFYGIYSVNRYKIKKAA
ncbi:MAG: hypothetical protein CFE23_05010 [Flavobacterium sp. BFFFF1]|nr:MAG: hypothetical protein CFE23_05010 [Flavobacterium sp. BFFFF1]